jgi:hypothetical protein
LNKDKDIFKKTISLNKESLLHDSAQHDLLQNISSDSEFLKEIINGYLEDIDISLICMNYRIKYGYELNPEFYNFVYTPVTERILFNTVTFLSTNSCVLLSGPPMTGKKESIKAISILVGRHLVLWNCSETTTYDCLT